LKVAAIVPAYNEADRIGPVLTALTKTPVVNQIIVVSDGSTDGTYQVASSVPGVTVVQLEQNVGKGGAMTAGAKHSDADVLLFLDADLIGLKPEHVQQILEPVLKESYPMSIGVFRGGRAITDLAQILMPYISGQRAILRELFLQIPNLDGVRAGVEMAITKYVKSQGLPVRSVVITGVTHPMKEEKLGYWNGVRARARMYMEIVGSLICNRS
jgi:glycosyltransferase involved in cell wall biosynthesis